VHYFVTGGGGKVRLQPPTAFEAAQTRAWAASGHFLLVEVNEQRMQVMPMGELSPSGALTDMVMVNCAGEPVRTPIVIQP
jgi:hypothetical protein